MFIAALFTTAKRKEYWYIPEYIYKNIPTDKFIIAANWKPQMSTNNRRDKLSYSHTIEYHTAMKKNKLLLYITIRQNTKLGETIHIV